MKIRKTSAWSVALALALVTSTCAVFATSAKAPEKVTITALTDSDSATLSSVEVRTNEKTGEFEISDDGGKTWSSLAVSDADTVVKSSEVVWWTADEYEKWLEQEKKDLQSHVGTGSGYTVNGVYHEWTQEHVDETIAMYEDILKDIKNGIKHSKTVDGRNDIAISMKPDELNFSEANSGVFSVISGDESVAFMKSVSMNGDKIVATDIEGNSNVAEVKNGVPLTKLTESTKSIPATEITIEATEIAGKDGVPLTKLTESTKSIPATKITELAKKSQ